MTYAVKIPNHKYRIRIRNTGSGSEILDPDHKYRVWIRNTGSGSEIPDLTQKYRIRIRNTGSVSNHPSDSCLYNYVRVCVQKENKTGENIVRLCIIVLQTQITMDVITTCKSKIKFQAKGLFFGGGGRNYACLYPPPCQTPTLRVL